MRIKKRVPIDTRFKPKTLEPMKLNHAFGAVHHWARRETPADFITLRSGTKLALLALGWGLKCTAAAHFFEDTLGIQLGLKALESPVNRLAFFHGHSTHAVIIGCFGWFRRNLGARFLLGRPRDVKPEPVGFPKKVGLLGAEMWHIKHGLVTIGVQLHRPIG